MQLGLWMMRWVWAGASWEGEGDNGNGRWVGGDVGSVLVFTGVCLDFFDVQMRACFTEDDTGCGCRGGKVWRLLVVHGVLMKPGFHVR